MATRSAESTDGVFVTPIYNINKDQDLVTIKARVTNKSVLRRNGKLLFEVLDKSGEIRCVSNETKKSKELDAKIKTNGVYTFTNMKVKRAQDWPFTPAIEHDFVLHASRETEIKEHKGIPNREYKFETIKQVRETTDISQKRADVIGICVNVDELEGNSGQRNERRDLTLVDDSTGPDPATGMTLTLWREQAGEFVQPETPFVVVARRAKVAYYCNRIKLHSNDCSMIQTNPELPEADRLMDWYKNAKKSTEEAGTSGSDQPATA